ncbi:efflux RND transporter permease subunit [Paenibacillus popilliae]|uniref:RND family transporter n=1 Tax=Paenibacillus popilliae TaxID=78057 RepID=A0ABY3AWU6_PAEPP|nr:hydrophobe/amphiphile efflux-3 (HAE3) family transporter [Paenibacillus sp. SDF0028]TQR46343.1 RND family transporter [Paenibacillus sp. SDF0028]
MDRLFTKFGDFIIRRSKFTIIVITILTVFFAFGLPKLEMQMGNNVFVNEASDVFKRTTTYQEQFGGESIFVMISGDSQVLFTQKTSQEIVRFAQKAGQIKDITGSMHYIGLMNEMLAMEHPSLPMGEDGASRSELLNMIMSAISEQDQQCIQQSMMENLTEQQQADLQNYTLSQLTKNQQQQLAAKMANLGEKNTVEQQNAILHSLLTQQQNDAIAIYAQGLLTPQQQAAMASQVLQALPAVQDMNDDLLHQLVFSDKGKVPSQLSPMISDNGEHIIIVLNTSKNTDIITYARINRGINQLIDSSNFDSKITVKAGGMPIILGEVKDEVMSTMAIMLAIAVVLMIVVLFLVFPVRRRVLSLAFVLIGLIWTFGFMGWAGLPITVATMATLPIIVGLGTDFGVQFHNRYEEELKISSYNAKAAVANSIRHMGPSVGIAVFVMALSFLTMLLSKAPMMQQFGVTLAIGVIFCYVIEICLLFSTFHLLDRKHTKPVKIINENTWLSRFLEKYTHWVGKLPIPILVVALVLSIIGFSTESSIPTETNLMKMIPQDLKALKDTNSLQDVVGSTIFITYLVEADDVTDPDTINWMNRFGDKIVAQHKDVEEVTSLPQLLLQMTGNHDFSSDKEQLENLVKQMPPTLLKSVVSANKQYATMQFKVNQELSSAQQLALMNNITQQIDASDGFQVSPVGTQVMMLHGIDNVSANHNLITITGLVVIFIGLLLAFRRLKYALYSLLPIVLVLGFSPGTLHMLDLSYNPLTIALSCLVLGIGTEFTILIMERYREEKSKGLSTKEAITVSLSKVGQAITVSGLTVMIGFSTLLFVSFPVLRSFGMTTVIDTLYSLVCALTILPAIIILFGKKKKSEQQNVDVEHN